MLEEADTKEVTEEAVTLPPVASWLSRAGAFALDVLLGLGVIAAIAAVAAGFFSVMAARTASSAIRAACVASNR